MGWIVYVSKKVQKQIKKLPQKVKSSLITLLREIEIQGPIRGNWSNYSYLGGNRYHCHLKKGNPTYVAVWEVTDKEIKFAEVSYVGTPEKAPY